MSDLTKVGQFQTIGDSLVVSMTSEVKDIQADLEKKYPVSVIPEDLSVKENYELVKSAIRDIKKPRIALEKDRKSISAVPFQLCKKINEAAKPIRESLVALEDSWKDTKTTYDEKVANEKAAKAQVEQERVDTIIKRIEDIRLSPITNMDNDSARLSEILLMVKNELNDVSWADEKMEQAQDVIGEAITRLEQLITGKESQEEIARQQKEAAAKLEADQKAADEKAQAEREEQDRKNKEEADRLAKEQEKFEAEKKKFRDEQEAKDLEAQKIEDKRLANIKKEDDARSAKTKAEDDAAKEKADKEEEDRLAFLAEENLATRIGEAAAQIQSLLDADNANTAFEIVTAIIDGKVPHVNFT